jgi:outer membrane protein OmpA-like peptidoglycan-associated protein
MTSKIRVGGRVMALVASGSLVMLAAGPAQAADWDLNHLPGFATDAKVLTASIGSWSDPETLSNSIESWDLDRSVFDLEETKHESGQTVVTLNADILFEFGKAALPATASARIGAAVAKAPKGSAVSIGGHTDDVGTDADNLKLSQARAQSVATAVKTARPDLVLTVKGFGESKPVASNGDPLGSAKNRRVEIRFAG